MNEITPKVADWYFVTLKQIVKEGDNNPDYVNDWFYFDGVKWDYQDVVDKWIAVKILKGELK